MRYVVVVLMSAMIALSRSFAPTSHRLARRGHRAASIVGPSCEGAPPSYRGVSQGGGGTWRATITSKGTVHRMGPFESAVAAARAYDEAAQRLHGRSASLNFPAQGSGGGARRSRGSASVSKSAASRGSGGGGGGGSWSGAVSSVPRGPWFTGGGDGGRGDEDDGEVDGEDDAAAAAAAAHLRALRAAHGPAWGDRLASLERPAAAALVPLLTAANPLGYDSGSALVEAGGASAREGTLLHFVLEEKRRQPDKVILVRVGDFFEAFGLDAAMLVEHAGLNPMGGKPRAGCPWRNVQATLDGLVLGGGLTVAVYEELAEPEAVRGAKRQGLKRRVLSQVVSPGSPTYMYDLSLRQSELDFKPSRPYAAVYCGTVGVGGGGGGGGSGGDDACGASSSLRGFGLVLVHVEPREVEMLERLSPEALRARLAAEGPVEPVFLSPGTPQSALPWRPGALATAPLPLGSTAAAAAASFVASDSSGLGASSSAGRFTSALLAFLGAHLAIDPSEFRVADRAAAAVATAHVLLADADNSHNSSGNNLSSSLSGSGSGPFLGPSCLPLYVTTAAEVGLMGDVRVPNLASALLPAAGPHRANAHVRLLRRWLLSPPPPAIADARSKVLALLGGIDRTDRDGGGDDHDDCSNRGDGDDGGVKGGGDGGGCEGLSGVPLPPLRTAVPLGKLVSLLSTGQGHPALFRDTASMLHGVAVILGAPPLPPALHLWSPRAALACSLRGAQAPPGAVAVDAAADPVAGLADEWVRDVSALADSLDCRKPRSDAEGAAAESPPRPEFGAQSRFEALVGPLLLLTAHESGLPVRRAHLLRACAGLLGELSKGVAPPEIATDPPSCPAAAAARGERISTASPGAVGNGDFGAIVDVGNDCDECSDEFGGGHGVAITASGGSVGIGSRGPSALLGDFFRRNEEAWRCSVRPQHNQSVAHAYADVAAKAAALAAAVGTDFPTEGDVAHDTINNRLLLRKRPTPRAVVANRTATTAAPPPPARKGQSSGTSSGGGIRGDLSTAESQAQARALAAVAGEVEALYFSPRDRTGKVMAGRYTTGRVEGALLDYLAACAAAERAVRGAVSILNAALATQLPSLVQSAHMAATLTCLQAHGHAASAKGWCLPKLVDFPSAGQGKESIDEAAAGGAGSPPLLDVRRLRPFWLAGGGGGAVELSGDARSGSGISIVSGGGGVGGGDGVGCDVSLSGGEMVLLTAPNMSGKSTLMRGLLAAALLANCGLHAPADAFTCPRFDGERRFYKAVPCNPSAGCQCPFCHYSKHSLTQSLHSALC